MAEQQRYYDDTRKIKIVEVAIKELDGENYTYLMTDDYLALAKEILQFGFHESFVERPFLINPRLSQSVREAMERAGATYSVTFSHGHHIMNRYVPGHEPEILNLAPFICHIDTWHPPLLSIVAGANALRQLEFLLDSHLPMEQEDRHGRTALIIAAQTNALDAGKLLIQRGASIDIRDSYGLTPLTAAISVNAIEFARLLLENGAKVNRFSVETSPLLLAAAKNSCDMIELLLDKGADINITSPRGSTPLLEALRYCAQEAACLLIDRGADIHIRDKRGLTPVQLLAQQGLSLVLRKLLDAKLLSQQDKECALVFSVIGNHLSLVKHLVYEKMDVNFQTKEGFSLLTLAAVGGYKEIVQFLLERGADLEHRDKMGMRPLDHAARKRQQEIQKMLMLQYEKKKITPQPVPEQGYQNVLNLFIDRYLQQHPGSRRCDIWKNTCISKQLFSDITRKAGYKTKKDKLLILAAKLQLSNQDLSRLLNAAGFRLSHADEKETEIFYAFACGNYSIVEKLLQQKNARSTR